ncbi:hypothetical protein [Clavibacter michiganensis]|uniref:hypothetical protein n=2 Tax=Clavibacter michiganensis TaxID=28447 RepID=UPI0030792AF5
MTDARNADMRPELRGRALERDSTVTHVLGPVWAVNGHAVTVNVGEDLRRTILDAVARQLGFTEPVRAVITDGPRTTHVVLRPDGSSVAEGDDARRWAGQSNSSKPTPEQVTLIGVHPVAGATAWAQLLGLPEGSLREAPNTAVVLVCRSTPVGINAAKHAIRALGTDVVRAVLVVADAPGRPVPAAAREQRVLAGAVPVVPVPWLPRLRAVAEISPELAGQLARPVQRITQALEGAHTAKEEKSK